MPKGKLQSARRKADKERPARKSLKANRFLGVHLSGGKNDKTALAVIEYFPSHDKLFLSHLHEKIRTEKDISADLFLHELLSGTYQSVKTIAVDAPVSLPLCVTCELECPGFENCAEPHITWMWKAYRKIKKKKKSLKLFTPYTQRCAEFALQSEIDPPFTIDEAFGSNLAPLSTRGLFIHRRLEDREFIETNSKLAIWTIGRELKCAKSHLKTYSHVAHGKEARAHILEKVVSYDLVFLYQQDINRLTENLQAFEAFFVALTAYFYSKKKFIKRPKGFPREEAWPVIPSF